MTLLKVYEDAVKMVEINSFIKSPQKFSTYKSSSQVDVYKRIVYKISTSVWSKHGKTKA